MGSITFNGVGKVFTRAGAKFVTLRDVDLSIQEKEFVAIVGPSGCGKTTCLRMAAGFEIPTQGLVSVAGRR